MSLETMLAELIRHEVAAALEPLANMVADKVAARTADSNEPLQPLATILGISPRAALGRLSRDPELRGLGHRLGRRLVFSPSAVRFVLAERQRDRSGE